MNDVWRENINALRESNPELADRLERHPHDNTIEKIFCHNGDVTIKCRGVTIHSRYDPRMEARRMVDEFLQKYQSEFERYSSGYIPPVIVFGFGIGYHVEILWERLQQMGIPIQQLNCVVVESNYSILRTALESRELSHILSNVSIIAGPDPELSALEISCSPLIYIHSPYRKLEPNLLSRIESLKYAKSKSESKTNRLKILAVSPIYGGSVPTLHYSVDALKDLGYKVEILDNTPYYDILMSIERITRDNAHQIVLRGLLTTYLAECAVAKALDIKADMIFGVAQSPMVSEALQELKKLNIPSVFWFVEDRYLFPYWKEYAPLWDHFFVIQDGEFIEELKSMGVKNIRYLPCAAHPPVHHPVSISPQEQKVYGSDISFMGAGYYNRHQAFLKLLDFNFKIWGQDWQRNSPLGKIVQKNAERISPEEYVKIFCASKINLNLHSSPTHEGVNPHGDFVNPRTFELAACKAFQLVDYRSQMQPLFDIGKELITFRDVNDLREKIKYYLDKPEERVEIAQQSFNRVLREHTYTHRMKEMMDAVVQQEPVLLTAKPAPDLPRTLLEQAGTDSELGRFLARFADEDELTIDRIAEEIRKGKGELTHTEGIFLLMKEFQDWAREKGVISA